MRWALAIALAFATVWSSAGAQSGEPAPPAFRVIVNSRNPQRAVGREFVAAAFLKKTTIWPGGHTIHPVDQKEYSAARIAFTRQVLGRSVPSVRNYWQQRIFTGRGVPPPELDSDEAIVRYVQKYPWAVGYVSANANLGDTQVLILK
jgi:hypothetical protein